MLNVPANVAALIEQKALFVINHSGGKDSQAMMIKLLGVVPAAQVLVVHASLGESEWDGALEMAQKQATDAGVPFIVAHAVKTFLGMVEHRFATRPEVPSWPSSEMRQCNSDLKRGPIEREVRRYMNARGLKLVVSCIGIRGAESASRKKAVTWKANKNLTAAGRSGFDWLPIHSMSTDEVWSTIAGAGQTPHPAYAAGNQRLSCVFCVMGSPNDIRLGAQARPELFAKYVEMEQKTGYTMHVSRKSLTELVADAQVFDLVA